MHQPIPRRNFLIAGAATIAATTSTNALPISAPPESPQSANEPRLFPGCCAYSYLKYFKSGAMTMEAFIDKAVELQSHSVDITTYWLKSTEPEYLISLRHLAFKKGMPLSGLDRCRRLARSLAHPRFRRRYPRRRHREAGS
jgi:hypothetical protein